MGMSRRTTGLWYLLFCILFNLYQAPKLHAKVGYIEERKLNDRGLRLDKKSKLPDIIKNRDSTVEAIKTSSSLTAVQNASSSAHENEIDKEIFINSPTEFDESLKVTKEAPEELLYKDKSTSWYRGLFIDRLPVDEGQTYCVNNFGSKAESNITKKISGVSGTMMFTTVLGPNFKVVKHYFECSIPGSILIDDYEGDKLDLALDDAVNREQKSNSLKKPYDRMEESQVKGFVLENIWPDLVANHERKIIHKAKAKISCPKNTTIQLYEPLRASDKDDVNGTKDTVVFACVSQQYPIGKICPVGTLFNEELDGMVPEIDKKTKIATYSSKVTGSCFRKICPSFLTPYNNQCVACPKGTSLNVRETSNFIKKGFFDRPVCVGAHGLATADEESN